MIQKSIQKFLPTPHRQEILASLKTTIFLESLKFLP
jgi:hypothetical protein